MESAPGRSSERKDDHSNVIEFVDYTKQGAETAGEARHETGQTAEVLEMQSARDHEQAEQVRERLAERRVVEAPREAEVTQERPAVEGSEEVAEALQYVQRQDRPITNQGEFFGAFMAKRQSNALNRNLIAGGGLVAGLGTSAAVAAFGLGGLAAGVFGLPIVAAGGIGWGVKKFLDSRKEKKAREAMRHLKAA